MLFTFTANAITNPATGEPTIPQPWPELLNTTTSNTTQPLPQPAIFIPTPSPIQSSLATYLAPDPIAVFRSLNTPQILADNNGTIKHNNLMVWEYLSNSEANHNHNQDSNLQSYIFALSNYIDSVLTAYNSSLALRTEETHAFVRNVLLSCFGPSSLVLLTAITKPLHASLRNSSLSPRYSKFQSHNKLSDNTNNNTNTTPSTSPHSYQSLPFPQHLISLIPTPNSTNNNIPTIQDWPTLIHAFLSKPDLLFSGSPSHHMSCQDLLCFFPNGDSGDANFPHLGIRTRWTAAAHLSHAPILTLYPRIWNYVFGPLIGKNPALISAVWEQPTPQKPRKDKGVPRAERF